MGKRFVRCLALAGFTVLLTITWVTGAVAQVTFISACGTLGTFGQTYKLTADLVASCGANCLEVTANRITIDGQGHTIMQADGCSGGAGVTDLGTARDQIIVKNVHIGTVAGQFDYGVNLGASTRTELRDVVTYGNLVDGMVVGSQAIVAGQDNVSPKTCRSVWNGVNGISSGDDPAGERVQVQDCEASWNGENGIQLGGRCLIVRNIANNNGENGIEAEHPCTVSFNTANSNGTASGEGTGIDIEGDEDTGTGTLATVVTGNTANNNAEEGIDVQCPATVTNNNASGNGSANYLFEGAGCFTNNNNSP